MSEQTTGDSMTALYRIVLGAALIAALTLQADAARKPCWELKKELTELRVQYHEYATGLSDELEEVTFDRLAEMVDRIVELKRIMRKSNCKIRSRKDDLKRYLKKKETELDQGSTKNSR
jgi:DNA repair ATPase RecN